MNNEKTRIINHWNATAKAATLEKQQCLPRNRKMVPVLRRPGTTLIQIWGRTGPEGETIVYVNFHKCDRSGDRGFGFVRRDWKRRSPAGGDVRRAGQQVRRCGSASLLREKWTRSHGGHRRHLATRVSRWRVRLAPMMIVHVILEGDHGSWHVIRESYLKIFFLIKLPNKLFIHNGPRARHYNFLFFLILTTRIHNSLWESPETSKLTGIGNIACPWTCHITNFYEFKSFRKFLKRINIWYILEEVFFVWLFVCCLYPLGEITISNR